MTSHRTSEPPAHCKQCNILFSTAESLAKHKEIMRHAGKRHYHCKICEIDFKTEMGEIRHIQLEHAKKQNLCCPGCGEGPFVRLGGLMSHIEKDCIRIDITTLEDMREEKMKFASNLEIISKKKVRGNFAEFMPSAHGPRPVPVTVSPKTDPLLFKKHEFFIVPDHDTNVSDEKVRIEPAVDIWGGPMPAKATTPSATTVIKSADPHDPSTPGFDAARYYNRFSQTYDCPRGRCEKCFKTKGSLIGHLKNAHSGKFYECPTCHKKFMSLTAITQHAESNGNFCRMREGTNYNAYMSQLTAGIVSVDINDHEDGTKKFNVDPEIMKRFGKDKLKMPPGDAAADPAPKPASWW